METRTAPTRADPRRALTRRADQPIAHTTVDKSKQLMIRASLVLDVDNVLAVKNHMSPELRRVVTWLISNIRRMKDVSIHINTARAQTYCSSNLALTNFITSRQNHHCLIDDHHPTSKVNVMRVIQHDDSILSSRSLLLVDDKPENIMFVRHAGFSGYQVSGLQGMSQSDARRILRKVRYLRRRARWRACQPW